jgi:hypothetical protein
MLLISNNWDGRVFAIRNIGHGATKTRVFTPIPNVR